MICKLYPNKNVKNHLEGLLKWNTEPHSIVSDSLGLGRAQEFVFLLSSLVIFLQLVLESCFEQPLAPRAKSQLLSIVFQTFPGLTSPWGISAPGPVAGPVRTACQSGLPTFLCWRYRIFIFMRVTVFHSSLRISCKPCPCLPQPGHFLQSSFHGFPRQVGGSGKGSGPGQGPLSRLPAVAQGLCYRLGHWATTTFPSNTRIFFIICFL